jgi:hypothetical protein
MNWTLHGLDIAKKVPHIGMPNIQFLLLSSPCYGLSRSKSQIKLYFSDMYIHTFKCSDTLALQTQGILQASSATIWLVSPVFGGSRPGSLILRRKISKAATSRLLVCSQFVPLFSVFVEFYGGTRHMLPDLKQSLRSQILQWEV